MAGFGPASSGPGHRADGRLEPGETRKPKGERLLIEIPAHIQTLKATDTDLALAWRMSVREACEAAFAAGYTACDVVRAEVDGLPRVYYLLEENSTQYISRLTPAV